MVAYDDRFGTNYDSPFVEWDKSRDGPRPICQSLAKIIIDNGAEFLFGSAPKFVVPNGYTSSIDGTPVGASALEHLIGAICDMNALQSKFLPLARQAANEGSVWLKFAWTPQNPRRPIAISCLSPWEVRAYRDPMDADIVQKVRVQIKYSEEDLRGNRQWYLYREVWTPEVLTVYQTLPTTENDDTQVTGFFVNGEWPIDHEEMNRFGLIPLVQIYNRKLVSESDGIGDLWDIYDILNQYNLTCWLEHRSNQWDVQAITAIINADSAPNAIIPGDVVKLNGDESCTIERIVPANNMRAHIAASRMEWERNALDGAGADRLNPAAITNMGEMTRAVMEMTFYRSVKSAQEKRINWGENGLSLFFEALLEGLSRLPDALARYPALKLARPDDPDSYDVVTQWPPMFRLTAQDGQILLANLTTGMEAGLITRQRAVKIAAEVYGIEDADVLLSELAAQQGEGSTDQD